MDLEERFEELCEVVPEADPIGVGVVDAGGANLLFDLHTLDDDLENLLHDLHLRGEPQLGGHGGEHFGELLKVAVADGGCHLPERHADLAHGLFDLKDVVKSWKALV